MLCTSDFKELVCCSGAFRGVWARGHKHWSAEAVVAAHQFGKSYRTISKQFGVQRSMWERLFKRKALELLIYPGVDVPRSDRTVLRKIKNRNKKTEHVNIEAQWKEDVKWTCVVCLEEHETLIFAASELIVWLLGFLCCNDNGDLPVLV